MNALHFLSSLSLHAIYCSCSPFYIYKINYPTLGNRTNSQGTSLHAFKLYINLFTSSPFVLEVNAHGGSCVIQIFTINFVNGLTPTV